MSSLFRPEVFQAKQNRWTGQIVLVRPFSLLFLTLCAALFAAALVAFTIFGSYTAKTTVKGQLLPANGVVRVYAPDAGVITSKRVNDGDLVQAGDVLFTLSTAREDGGGSVQARLAAEAKLKKTLAEQEIVRQKRIHAADRAALENSLRRLQGQMRHIKNQISVQERRVVLSEKMLTKQRQLAKEGAISQLEKTSYENALLELKADLAAYKREEGNLEREIASQQSNLKNLPEQQSLEISQLERAAASYSQEILDYSQREGQTLRAAVAGHVSTVNGEVGQQVDGSRLLLSIVPADSELLADLYVPSRAIGFVKPGDAVILRYQAYPYQKFGHASGKIISIARTALGQQELASLGNGFADGGTLNEPAYLVKVKPDRQTMLVYGERKPLQSGMVLEADILHDRRQLYEWVLEPLYSVAGRLGH